MSKNRHIDFSGLRLIKAGSFKEFLYERDSSLFEDNTEELEVKARIKVQKAILWININRGFFGQLLANLNIYGSSTIRPKTMCTNGLNIVYHPEFVLGQSDAAVRFVLCHEILHCVGDHMGRRGNRDPLLWNYAADYAINPILDSESDSNFSWPMGPDGKRMGLYEKKYEGMRAEDIYDILINDPETKKQLESMPDVSDFGQVVDADQDLDGPDSAASVAQETFGDEEGEEATGSGIPKPQQGKPEGSPKPGEGGEPQPGEDGEPGDSQAELVGKKVRVTEGPDAGKIGTVKQVLPNGDIIIDVE